MGKMHMKCANCGSENVFRDAWASWDAENQEWVLANVFDHAWCEKCEGETRIVLDES